MANLFSIQLFCIFIGGGIGSILRFLMSASIERYTQNIYFPWGILLVNLLGGFLIGIIVGVLFERYDFGVLWRSLIIIGLLGGFTTFSSFSIDAVTLLLASEYVAAFSYIFLSVAGSLTATFLGLSLIRLII